MISKYLNKNKDTSGLSLKHPGSTTSQKERLLSAQLRENRPGGVGTTKRDSKSMIEKAFGKNHFADSILRKYQDSHDSNKDSLKNNSLYQKFSKKLSLARGLSGDNNQMNPHDREGAIIKKNKSKTLANVGLTAPLTLDLDNPAHDPHDLSQINNLSLYSKKKTYLKGQNDEPHFSSGNKSFHKRSESEKLKKVKSSEAVSSVSKMFVDLYKQNGEASRNSRTNFNPQAGHSSHPINPPSRKSPAPASKGASKPVSRSISGKKEAEKKKTVNTASSPKTSKSPLNLSLLQKQNQPGGPKEANISGHSQKSNQNLSNLSAPQAYRKSAHLESIKKNEHLLPKFEGSKVIIKDFGIIRAFSVNTHQGTVRNYNEDRVSILLNAQQR